MAGWRAGTIKMEATRVIAELRLTGKRDVRLALTMTCSARNLLPGPSGFSPSQWVLGRSARLPGSLTQRPGELPTMQAALEEPTFAHRLAVQQAAQGAMTALDSSSRLRRALLRRSRPERGPFLKGDSVYFWRRRAGGKKSKTLWRSGWQGPAVVVAVQGRSTLFPSFCGTLVRVAPEMARKARPSESLTFQELMKEVESARLLLDGPGIPVDDAPIELPPPFGEEDSVGSDADQILDPPPDEARFQGRRDEERSMPDFDPYQQPFDAPPAPGHPIPQPWTPTHHEVPFAAPHTPAEPSAEACS